MKEDVRISSFSKCEVIWLKRHQGASLKKWNKFLTNVSILKKSAYWNFEYCKLFDF